MKKAELERLFREYYPEMYQRALTILYDRQESDDVVCGIFEVLLRQDMELLPDRAEPYLLKSVRNECLKRIHQKSNRERLMQFYAKERLIDEDLKKDEERLSRLLVIAHRCLTRQEQDIFHMRFLEGQSYDDIAAELGISRVAVWKHLSHLVKTLKHQFNNH